MACLELRLRSRSTLYCGDVPHHPRPVYCRSHVKQCSAHHLNGISHFVVQLHQLLACAKVVNHKLLDCCSTSST